MRCNRGARVFAMIAAMATGTGCSSRAPGYADMPPDSLFALGMQRLEDEDWGKAREIFDVYTFQHPTHEQYREGRFRLAQAYYGQGEYLTAALEYGRFASDYPDHELADDARFGVCQAYETISPKPQLDPEYTYDAIDHCISLLAYYPESEFAPRAEAIVRAMREKLAEKKYDEGEHYQRNGIYDSAIMSYQALLAEFADTTFAPKGLLRLYEVYQRLEYMEEAQDVRERLLTEYPDSEEAREIGGARAGRS